MHLLARLGRWFLGATVLTAIGSAVAAAVLRDRLVSRGKPADDDVVLAAVFGSLDFTSTARSFRHGLVTALFGGGTLDLRLATLDPAGATLTTRLAFGGYRVAVPGTWRVELRGFGLIGGYGDGRRREWLDPNGPVLRIEGWALFGGIGVVSETPDSGPPRPQTFPDSPDTDEPGGTRGLVTDPEGADAARGMEPPA